MLELDLLRSELEKRNLFFDRFELVKNFDGKSVIRLRQGSEVMMCKMYDRDKWMNYESELTILQAPSFNHKPDLLVAVDSKDVRFFICRYLPSIAGVNTGPEIFFNILDVVSELHNCGARVNRQFSNGVEEIKDMYSDFKYKDASLLDDLQECSAYFQDYKFNHLIHGDLFLKNVLIQKDGIKLFDFEWASIGPASWDFYKFMISIKEQHSKWFDVVRAEILRNRLPYQDDGRFELEAKMYDSIRRALKSLTEKK